MSEREDTGFKVTDRRKYNPDGSLRESSEETPPSPAAEPSDQQSSAAKILSFPGDPANKQQSPAQETGPSYTVNEPRAGAPPADEEVAANNRAKEAYNQARGPDSTRLPNASFLGIVNMLGVEAAMHLGLIQTPGEEPLPVDTDAARHLIDMLGILQTKTKGNLTPEEDHIFENMLADLRMQFVAVSRRR